MGEVIKQEGRTGSARFCAVLARGQLSSVPRGARRAAGPGSSEPRGKTSGALCSAGLLNRC